MQKVDEPAALTRAKPTDDAEQLPYLVLAGGRPIPGRRHRCRELGARTRAGVRSLVALRHGAWLLQRAHGGEQIAELPWLGQDRNPFRKYVHAAARPRQPPLRRGRALRPQPLDPLPTPPPSAARGP